MINRRVVLQFAMIVVVLLSGIGIGVAGSQTDFGHSILNEDNATAHHLNGTDNQRDGSPKRTYYEFDEPFIVNFINSQVSIQFTIGVSSLYESSIDDLRYNRYAVRSAIILELSGFNPESANSDFTKAMVMSKVKSAILKTLKSENVEDHFEKLYLTNYLAVGLDA